MAEEDPEDQALQAHKDRKVLQVAHKGIKAHKVFKERMECKAFRVCKAFKAFKDFRE